MANLQWPARQALFSAISTAVAPMAVYDKVPPGAALPYVTISGTEAVPDNYVAGLRSDLFVYLTVWSGYHGAKEVLETLDKLRGLHGARPVLAGGAVALSTWVIRENCERDADEITYQGNMTLRVLIEH